jgi:hypothetical protein
MRPAELAAAMSLVGSLEDLGLGDLLQIVHLAAKTGVLRLRGDAGEGQIVFRSGMIREARAKSGPTDLRELLAAKRAVAGPLLERAWIEAHHVGRRLADVLVERGLVTAEALDELRREQIESSVLAMFAWPSGEFSFEMREWVDDEAELAIDPGLNPQFLALEGTRRADERGQEPIEPSGDPIFAAPEDTPASLVLAEEATQLAPPSAAVPPPGVLPPARPPAGPSGVPVVLIDPSLAALEWAKAALGPEFSRVHVFQRPSLGIDRIRQYLARAELPLVVVAEDTPPDSAAAARDANEIVARLKRQAPAMPVLLLCDESAPERTRRTRADGVVTRPSAALLADPRSGRERTRIATALAETLTRLVPLAPERKPVVPVEPAPETAEALAEEEATQPDADALLRLRETSARIREGAGRGAVLAEVLGFAAQRFARVALFGVRGDRAVGVAQVGLGRSGGPDDEALRELSLGSREPAWFRRALDERRPLRSAPTDNGDHRLAVLLGNEIPSEAYVAPIVTGERVAALLYADNLPGREPLGDTAGLEVLLDAAGIALDRALIERTLTSGRRD